MQNMGLEWFYRFIQEPRRMWKRYLTTNSVLLFMLAREWMRKKLG
jgi:N-acetylglucosaminyldiphosphoundecaprenol N-acetyl-beta-D-mannosaminyltransferase